MAGTDQLSGGTGSTQPNGQKKEMTYAPWEYVNDIYGLTDPSATAPVLMAKGETFYGYKPTVKPGTGGEWGTGEETSDKYRFRGDLMKTGGTANDVRTLRDAMNWAMRLDEKQLGMFTNAMYAAGFYHDSQYAKGSQPPNGLTFDDQAQFAAMSLYKEVVKYNAANPQNPKSMPELLKERIDAAEGQKKIDSTAGGQGQVYQVVTSDPATLRATVTSVAQKLLGRNVSEAEQNALVETMLQAERAPQEAAINAGQTAEGGTDIRLQQARIDAEARMNEKIKAENPNEVEAYAEMNYANVLRQMMEGGPSGG